MVTASTSLWLEWNLSPVIVAPLLVLLCAHIYALGPLRRRLGEDAPTSAQMVYLTAGYATLWLSLISPLDHLGDEYLFSAHMIQHMVIAIISPPLLLLGTPQWLQDWLVTRVHAERAVRWIGQPIVAFGIFNADLWLWHAPTIYDATLYSDPLHALEHGTFFVFGLLFWLPVLGPARIVPRISKGFGVFYLFLACQPMVVLGALLTFSATPLYAPYVVAPRMWGMSPLQDQQLGGLIMWLPTNIPYLIGLTLLFFQWLNDQERDERARENLDEPYELFPGATPQVPVSAESVTGVSAATIPPSSAEADSTPRRALGGELSI